MAISLFIVDAELLSDIKKEKVTEVEQQFHEFMKENHAHIIETINLKPELTPDIKEELTTIFNKFKAEHVVI